ncbi:MAG: NUDIX hydrolase [Methylotenera sp.]|nr:NUDIX hydrolase [Methylotenera sp.]
MLHDAENLTEHCLHSETLVSGNMLMIKRDLVRLPNGHTSQREYVMHPGAVVVVPLLANGHVVLEKQYRYALHQAFVELPAGKIDKNEEVLRTGQRELQEETGYTATEWVKLGLQHPCIGYSDEVIHIYLARGLCAGTHQRDEDELLRVFDLSLPACIDMIQSGGITDSKTIVALYMAEKYLAQHG